MDTDAAPHSVTRHQAGVKAEIQQSAHGMPESTEARLREAVIRNEALLRQKDDLIEQKEIAIRESDHRVMNSLQMIGSLLSMQSRATKNAEAAAQLTMAASRVAAIGHIHRHLRAWDGAASVELKQYLENLCHHLSGMLSTADSENVLVVEAIALEVPTAIGVPLGLIVNELITNSVKHAKGKIAVRLETAPGKDYALSVSDGGRGLPEGFDPAATNGFGLKIISSLVKQIGGQLQIGRGDDGKGARFTVLFS